MGDDVTGLLAQLVAIDSVNPALVPGGAGERELASFVAGWATESGLHAEVLEGTPGRPSVVVRAPGRGGGKTLLLCGHGDTVGVEGMRDPHAPRVEGDRLYGRGAYDMKAGVAAALIACREAAALDLPGDVVVAVVADEEHASLGIREVLASLHADAAVVTEPTETALVIAHRGFVWSEVEVQGRAAHGSRPYLGIDAIVKMGPILTAVGELDEALHAGGHPLLGRPSVHASLIEGGEGLSTYPARCVLSLERRTLPGETEGDVEAELDALLHSCRLADPGLVVSRRTVLARAPFEIVAEAELVELVGDAVTATLGAPPAVEGASYWADSGLIAAAGIPTVLYGPGGAGAHEPEEWVSVSDTEKVARVLVDVARRVCA